MNTDIKSLVKAALLCLLFIQMTLSFAGTNCNNSPLKPEVYSRAAKQALALKNDLNRTQAKVALIARVGSDLSKYGLHYSHLGIAIKDFPGRKNKWTVVHLLNKCGTARSAIHAQGLMNFFLDDLFNMDYQITVLDPALQTKLDHTLRTPQVNKIHNAHYSMLAYPFSTRYQNSNQWVLEFIEATDSGKPDRASVQKQLQAKHYKATLITLDAFTKLGASLFKANVRFDDHPAMEQRSNRYSSITVDSVVDYLQKQGKVVKNIQSRRA